MHPLLTNYGNELKTGTGKKMKNRMYPLLTNYGKGLKTGTESCNPRLICVRFFIFFVNIVDKV